MTTLETIAKAVSDIAQTSKDGNAELAHRKRVELMLSTLAHIAIENPSNAGELAGAVLAGVRVGE